MSNPVDRFSSRVADYDKYRPSYPLDLINKLFYINACFSSVLIAHIKKEILMN